MSSPEAPKYFVWWLCQHDYERHERLVRPAAISRVVWREVESREGRGGGYRLWIPSGFPKVQINKSQEEWDALKAIVKGDAGGIIIPVDHINICKYWGGVVTDLDLKPI